MLRLISAYWGEPLTGTIECYVVKDLSAWPAGTIEEAGRAKITQGAGITLVETLNRGPQLLAAKAVVYATADRGTPQHEAVHAYCGQTFGRTGPLWYSEGMAELGQYWREGDSSVACPDYVIEYLRSSQPKSVRQIVAEDGAAAGAGPARTGDSWQNYAWRWALCHLLDANPNYSARFRPLGLGYLSGAPVSFAETFGPMVPEIEFEYGQFLAHVAPGFRVDLCRWDWGRKFREPREAPIHARIAAARGWQPTGAVVRRGRHYDYRAQGTWQIEPQGERITADGRADGAGRLEGVIFHDYALGEPFALAARGTLAPPADGRLYVRCRDRWNELADNTGGVSFAIRAANAGGSRPGPLGADVVETPGPADAQ
jgi:hypothetical protein